MPGRGGPTAEGLEPADDDLINLLHRTGRAAQAFTAEVHEWLDGDFVTHAVARGREFLPPPWTASWGRTPYGTPWPAARRPAQGHAPPAGAPGPLPDRQAGRPLAGRPGDDACDGEHQWLVREPR